MNISYNQTYLCEMQDMLNANEYSQNQLTMPEYKKNSTNIKFNH